MLFFVIMLLLMMMLLLTRVQARLTTLVKKSAAFQVHISGYDQCRFVVPPGKAWDAM